jgi:hypothetical protein
MGTFICQNCGRMIDLLLIVRHRETCREKIDPQLHDIETRQIPKIPSPESPPFSLPLNGTAGKA